MLFQDYLKREKITKYRAAKDLGIAWTTIWRWCHSDPAKRSIPQPEQMKAVQTYTKGEVTPNDWVQVAPVQGAA